MFIPKPVLALGFALEQPLRDATLAFSASGISKQLEFTCSVSGIFRNFQANKKHIP
jgi:hypothetical protein